MRKEAKKMKAIQKALKILRRKPPLVVLVVLVVLSSFWGIQLFTHNVLQPSFTTGSSDWKSYNYDLANSGENTAETTLNASSFPNLKVKWTAHGKGGISAQPIVMGNVVYWGSWDGILHATAITGINAGTNLWTLNLGVTTGTGRNEEGSCALPIGIADTPSFGFIGSTPTLYIAGGGNDAIGDGNIYLYAINVTDHTITWKTPIGKPPADFGWSSPELYNGSVYYAMASLDDCPLDRGRVIKLDAATGKQQAIFYVEPAGCLGGGIWGSPSIDTASGNLYVPVGNSDCKEKNALSGSLLELKASDLSFVGSWTVPDPIEDGDSASVPTLFKAMVHGKLTQMVGFSNKNGKFYAFDRTNIAAGPLWTRTVAMRGGPQQGKGTISPPVWDGKTLYVAGGKTNIDGITCKGSVRAINPATGAFKWQYCMKDGPVLGPLAGVPGVVVANGGSTVVALDTSTGHMIFRYHIQSKFSYYAGPSISNGYLFAAHTSGSSLRAFGL